MVHSVLLVEDERRTRERIAAAIARHPELELVAAVGSCAAGLLELERRAPAVLLTDYGLPDGSGVDLITAARRRGDATLSLVITVFADEARVITALEAGAMGYLLKDGDADQITRAILELVAGGSPVSPGIARYLLKRFAPAPSPAAAGGAQLSGREQEVLVLIAKGFTYKEIADLLGVSTHTVTTHVRHIYRKLAVGSRGEAVFEAAQRGLVKLAE